MVRFFKGQRRFFCGIDLHASKMYVCIVNDQNEVVYHRTMRTGPDELKRALAPYRDGLVVGAECMFSWYWIADWCREEGVEFVLGHALSMKAIHGGKARRWMRRLPTMENLGFSIGRLEWNEAMDGSFHGNVSRRL